MAADMKKCRILFLRISMGMCRSSFLMLYGNNACLCPELLAGCIGRAASLCLFNEGLREAARFENLKSVESDKPGVVADEGAANGGGRAVCGVRQCSTWRESGM